MASTCEQVEQGKTSWPELVGEPGESAARTIESENPFVYTQIILEGTPIATIFLCDRVLVWVNDEGIVVTTPTNGMALRCQQVEQGKTSWPELVGEIGEFVARTIENENMLVKTRIILQGTIIPQIYLCHRVIVWVNNKGTVIRIPRIG